MSFLEELEGYQTQATAIYVPDSTAPVYCNFLILHFVKITSLIFHPVERVKVQTNSENNKRRC
jgi:hypothetical protein